MAHKRLGPALAALAVVVMIVVAGTARASTPTRVTICFNRRTGVVHYSASGRCGSGQTAVVIGKGAVGVRGPKGVAGAAGVQGVQGPDGSPGSIGFAGPTGSNGADGGTGAAGAPGPAGAVGGSASNGGTGPTGGTGVPGVNTFHRVISATDTDPGGVVEATCDPGEVVSGGGFSANGGNVSVKNSVPNLDGTRWSVSFTSGAGSSVIAYAVCVAGTSHT